eukprot:6482416-Amphidinium_carterae.2
MDEGDCGVQEGAERREQRMQTSHLRWFNVDKTHKSGGDANKGFVSSRLVARDIKARKKARCSQEHDCLALLRLASS